MAKLFHRLTGLSMAIAMLLGGAADAAAPTSSTYYGRWTVSEERPVFTTRGRLYKTIDIAPCGNDFCGVSVTDAGRCGAVMFRFLGHRANSPDSVRGHARWGSGRKNVVIWGYDFEAANPADRELSLSIGDGYDFGERSENMPTFQSRYHRLGAARCIAR